MFSAGGFVMRTTPAVLMPLVGLIAFVGLLIADGSTASAKDVCIRAADGAVVCGAVLNRGDNRQPSPFDRPGIAKPIADFPPVTEPRPVRHRAAREAERYIRHPRHVYRPPPPREFERHPPRRIVRADVRRSHIERERPYPPRYEHEPPARYRVADRHRRDWEREQALMRARREHAVHRYVDRHPPPPPRAYRAREIHLADLERRMHELERELRVLRADQAHALRRAERRDARRPLYREPPPRYHESNSRYRRERYVAQRVNRRHVDRERRPVDD
jgi:hypothetical protein